MVGQVGIQAERYIEWRRAVSGLQLLSYFAMSVWGAGLMAAIVTLFLSQVEWAVYALWPMLSASAGLYGAIIFYNYKATASIVEILESIELKQSEEEFVQSKPNEPSPSFGLGFPAGNQLYFDEVGRALGARR